MVRGEATVGVPVSLACLPAAWAVAGVRVGVPKEINMPSSLPHLVAPHFGGLSRAGSPEVK